MDATAVQTTRIERKNIAEHKGDSREWWPLRMVMQKQAGHRARGTEECQVVRSRRGDRGSTWLSRQESRGNDGP